MTLRTLPALAGILVLVLAASCTAATDGIFATVESEKKTVDTGNLSNYATITHMTEFGGQYYVAGGKALFHRGINASDWTSLAKINGTTANFVAVGSTSTRLYAVINTGASATNALYSSTDGTAWTNAGLTYTPYSMVPVRSGIDGQTSTELVVSSATSDTLTLLSGTTVTSVTLTSAEGAAGNAISAAAYSTVSSKYYLVNDSFLISAGASLASPTIETGVPDPSTYGHGYQGVLVTGSGANLYLSNRSNSTTGAFLFKATVSGSGLTTWGVVSTSGYTYSGYPVSFSQLFQGPSYVWIGTGAGTSNSGYQGYGYGTTDGSSLNFMPALGTDSSNFTSTALNTYAIQAFFKAPTNGTYFLGTDAHGLWAWNTSGSSNLWEQQ
jgi:hypothetical protein